MRSLYAVWDIFGECWFLALRLLLSGSGARVSQNGVNVLSIALCANDVVKTDVQGWNA